MEQHTDLILDTMKLYRLSQRRVMLELGSSLCKSGLTPLQFSILELLYHQGEMCIVDVMRQLCATKGNMTVVIKNMVEKEWIYRNVSPLDKRSSVIGLLPLGRNKTEEYIPIHHETIKNIYQSFTCEELLEFGKLLNKMK